MLRILPVTAILALLAWAPAAAQTPLLDALAAPPDEPEVSGPPPVIEAATLTMAEAAALAERLADDVLVIGRIRDLQTTLLAVNVERAKLGAAPLRLPGALCEASPLVGMCARLANTFSPPSGGTP